jgi:pimeloyl-ACP methyl ester carboxylesterase
MTWRERLLAPTVGFPQWSAAAPHRLFFISEESGSPQIWTLDLAGGRRQRLTDQPVGVEELVVLPDGSGVAWWADDTGAGLGGWMVTEVDVATTRLLIPDLPPGWSQGLSLAHGVVAVGLGDDRGYRIMVASAGSAPRVLAESTSPLGLGREWETWGAGLSADGTVLVHRRGEDVLHFGLTAFDVATGASVGELVDPGLTVKVGQWSPVAGDQRLALIHERDGIERPAIWDLAAGIRRDYPLDLPGPVDVAGWWPDGSGLLVLHHFEGRRTLHRLDPVGGALATIAAPEGWVSAAAVRPDGEVWLRVETAERPPMVLTSEARPVLAAPGPVPPPGRPKRSVWFTGGAPTHMPTHMMVALPAGHPPYPAVMLVHGGPEWADVDDFDPWEQALVDHGYAVARVNYRGSTGSDVAWRTFIHRGNIGLPEVEDVVAGLDHLVAGGTVDSARVAIEGWSWGGYVALLAVGLHPDRFGVCVAGIPVCDLAMAHEDCAPAMQAYDRAIMGGSPTELPDRYAERSPITYSERSATPTLLIAGEHDSACPIRQVRHYHRRRLALGHEIELHVYQAGHHATSVAERLTHAELRLDFLRRHLGR